MQTNTEMRAIQLPIATPSSRAITVPMTARALGRALPQPSETHRKMIAFIGRWRFAGGGTCTGEWMPGERALILRWNQRPDTVDAHLWVMTIDGRHSYALHRFDDAGRAVAYQVRADGDVWSIDGTDQRATITFTDGGRTMTQIWWVREGTAWRACAPATATRG